jgi:hypothetical protein
MFLVRRIGKSWKRLVARLRSSAWDFERVRVGDVAGSTAEKREYHGLSTASRPQGQVLNLDVSILVLSVRRTNFTLSFQNTALLELSYRLQVHHGVRGEIA